LKQLLLPVKNSAMNEMEKIKLAFERAAKALRLKPSLGRDTGITKARVIDGLTCEIEAGAWKFKCDMPEGAGGNNAAPTPGMYGRGALAACLAMGYMMQAAVKNISIQSLEVEVQADYDDGVLFGTVTDQPAGYSEVRYIVNIGTNASEETIHKLIEEADRRSPYLDIFSKAQNCKRQVHITSPLQQ
jgi:uncharacterized OsmC-like protein